MYIQLTIDIIIFSYITEAHKIHCSPDFMRVDIILPDNSSTLPQVYLQGMKEYPNPACHAQITDSLAKFKLSLLDIYECGVTRVVNKITGKKVYYHKIVIENKDLGKEIVSVKCITTPSTNKTKHLNKRDTLPDGFKEQE